MTTISIAKGDGIGPEIMNATLEVLEAAGAPLEYEEVGIGYEVYKQGNPTGLASGTLDTLRRNKVFLKAPIITPQGGGNKSVTVTIRKSLGLFANVRPSRALSPYVPSSFPKMDIVVVRENEEDLYIGMEHQQTAEVVQCVKLISRPGSERAIRFAFEYARQHGRKRVSCMTKDNIMKQTDGLFRKIFDEVATEYPEIENDHYIIDIGAALLADKPEMFDVVVTLNLYGDIATDITSQISGSVGLGGSFNIGNKYAMFEAVHGAAPDIAGQGLANPSGLINAACLMLLHLGHGSIASSIQNALLKTLEDGIHTGDIESPEHTQKRVGTQGFVDAIISRLGQEPMQLKAVHYPASSKPVKVTLSEPPTFEKQLMGVDIVLDWNKPGRNPKELREEMLSVHTETTALTAIANRGIVVYPNEVPEIDLADHWVCRFEAVSAQFGTSKKDIFKLLQHIDEAGLDYIKTENLYYVNGKRAYSHFQGE